MTHYSQKWTLVTFLQPIAESTRYAMQDWPLHVTLADVFAADFERTRLADKLKRLIESTPSFHTTALHEAQLGNPQSLVDVTLLEKNDAFVAFHNALVELLGSNGAIFNTPAHTGSGFLPHITVRHKKFLDPGTPITIDTVALIDMFPDNDWQQRKVAAIFKLQ